MARLNHIQIWPGSDDNGWSQYLGTIEGTINSMQKTGDVQIQIDTGESRHIKRIVVGVYNKQQFIIIGR